MPTIDGKTVTPEDALAQDRCPECGKDFKKESAIACANSHWMSTPQPGRAGAEARRRQKLLAKYIEDHKIEAAKPELED